MTAPTPINLNKVRKARDQATAHEAAARNRIVHGRTKAEKKAAADASRLADRRLDQNRRDP